MCLFPRDMFSYEECACLYRIHLVFFFFVRLEILTKRYVEDLQKARFGSVTTLINIEVIKSSFISSDKVVFVVNHFMLPQ